MRNWTPLSFKNCTRRRITARSTLKPGSPFTNRSARRRRTVHDGDGMAQPRKRIRSHQTAQPRTNDTTRWPVAGAGGGSFTPCFQP